MQRQSGAFGGSGYEKGEEMRKFIKLAALGHLLVSSACLASSEPKALDNKPAPAAPSPFVLAPLSPSIGTDGSVTFRFSAAQATSVEVKGSFPNPYQPETVKLARNSEGEWVGTSSPLMPDMYSYNIYVDGISAMDPGNAHFRRDAGRLSNTFTVSGTLADLYTVKPVPHGTVSGIWYLSAKFARQRRAMVYTPPGYEGGSEHYPVLFLLHGGMGDEDSWSGNGRVPQILDNLIASKAIVPMIVVMPNVNASQTASSDYIENFEPQGSFFDMDFPDSLVSELVPFIDRTYRTRPDSLNRAVAGLSMGGAHALWAAFKHPGTFSWVESMSGGYMIIPGLGLESSRPTNTQIPDLYRFPTAIDPDKVFAVLPGLGSPAMTKMRMFTLTVGAKDMLLGQQRTLAEALQKRHVRATVSEVPGYSHEWGFWRKELVNMLPRLFRTVNH